MVPSGMSLLSISKLLAPSLMNHKSVLGLQLEGGEQKVSTSQQVPQPWRMTLLSLQSLHGDLEKQEALGGCVQACVLLWRSGDGGGVPSGEVGRKHQESWPPSDDPCCTFKIQLYSKESGITFLATFCSVSYGKISSKAKDGNHKNGKPTLKMVLAQNPGKFDLSDSISLPCCYIQDTKLVSLFSFPFDLEDRYQICGTRCLCTHLSREIHSWHLQYLC